MPHFELMLVWVTDVLGGSNGQAGLITKSTVQAENPAYAPA